MDLSYWFAEVVDIVSQFWILYNQFLSWWAVEKVFDRFGGLWQLVGDLKCFNRSSWTLIVKFHFFSNINVIFDYRLWNQIKIPLLQGTSSQIWKKRSGVKSWRKSPIFYFGFPDQRFSSNLLFTCFYVKVVPWKLLELRIYKINCIFKRFCFS